MNNQQFQRDIASYQQEQDFLKHLTTLSTGSILLMVTFLEKLFLNPQWKHLVWVSFLSFALSIIGCLSIHLLSVLSVSKDSDAPISNYSLITQLILLLVAFLGFLTGIISLICFALKNFDS